MFEKINSDTKNFTHIIHVADIHIRLTKRHEEYREVFNRFYEDIKKSPETTIICVVGDVCHSKSDLSPECVQMVSEFLSSLANLRETILVPGNHDATLANKTRLDSLSPIVEALNHPKLHYLKETKLYGIGNILFNNMCIFDNAEKYIHGNDIPDKYRNEYQHIIALFHGPMDRSVTDTGFAISNPAIMPPLFDWHNIALLGDIHRRQNMQEEVSEEHKPCIHYPGSLIQQNHGEPLHPHGYTLWELKDYSYHYKEIPNDYGYFTIDIHGSKILTDLSDLPAKTYLRIRCLDSIPSDIKTVEALLSSLTELIEISRVKIESEADKKAKETEVCKDVKLSEIANIDYQGGLISEFVKNKLNITDQDIIDKILLINRNINSEIKKDEFSRNLKWIPIRFEWSNMFSYGEDNYIDFKNMSGVYGIFGPNTSGKSSIFSAMCFCLFDKWDRGFKAMVVKNVSKPTFKCKFEIEINGIRYFIEKEGTTTKNGNVKVEVNFWRTIDGKNEDLTDIMRRKTNDVIKDYIGTFEDFILTTLSIQNTTKNNVSFIDMGNTERKDLLVQFIGLNIFDKLCEAADNHKKELTTLLKPHKEKNYNKELEDSKNNLGVLESAIESCQATIEDLSKQIRNVNENIVSETSKIIKLDHDVPIDIKSLENRKKALLDSMSSKMEEMKKQMVDLESRRQILEKLEDQLSEVLAEDLVKAHKEYKRVSQELEALSRTYDLKKLEINHKLDKLKKLEQYKYDPNCKFCVENVFVKDAKKTQTELNENKSEISKLESQISDLKNKIIEWSWVDEAYQNYTKLLTSHSKAKENFSSIQTTILLGEKDIEKISQNLKDIQYKIELFHKNEISLENNQKVNMIILTLKNALNKLETSMNEKRKELLRLSGEKEVSKSKIEINSKIINDILKIEKEREIYEYYTQAVGRNGIPYQVILNTIPQITHEVNSILTQITNFTIEIEVDDKNIIPYVNYETKGKWPIEMTSGFERFITSVAFRVALSNISNLPRSPMLLIDEGWGCLDKEHLASVPSLLTVLKHYFDFVIIISHLDDLRDFVENQIDLQKDANYSKVTFE